MSVGVPLIAHRLGRDGGPDSSRAALATTLAGPADGVETDVCLTADGRLALLHDAWLSSATTAAGWAHQTTWEQLSTARLRNRDGRPTGETPMLLEELLELVPERWLVQIEIKAHGDAELARLTAAATSRVTQSSSFGHRFEILSFFAAACEQAARLGSAARLVTWADYAPDALIAWAKRTGVRGVCIEHFLLHPELMARLRLGGLSISTGTINDASLANRAAGLGVDAITTDRPAALHRELDQLALAA